MGLTVDSLIKKSGADPSLIDSVIIGNVVPFLKGPNIAREVIYHLNLPEKIFGYTVSTACISGLKAVTNAIEELKSEKSDVVIAGGVESISNMPVTYRETFIKSLFMAQREKNFLKKLLLLLKANPVKNIFPEIPHFQEYSTGLKMGDYAELLAEKFDIPRKEMDEFALLSHQKASRAIKTGKYKNDVIEINLPSGIKLEHDTSVREDTSIEKLSNLKPAFKKKGKVTAGNSSPPTDGAAAILLTSERKAVSDFTPMARIKNYTYTATNNKEGLLLGSAYAIAELLRAERLSLSDIDVFEIHEAFASQIIATLRCLNSRAPGYSPSDFVPPDGQLKEDRLNLYGGSISLGHPFSATGIRLIMNAIRILKDKGGQYAVISSCAAGGLGAALLIENIS